jgi:hypothetical protein
MVNEALKPFPSGTCLRAIKLPFTKRITTAGVVDSRLRKAVSDLLRFRAAIVARGVNDFGVDRIDRSGFGGGRTPGEIAQALDASAPFGLLGLRLRGENR